MPVPIGIDAAALAALSSVVNPVAERFNAAGHRIYLVGGIVRDLALGRPSGFDIDLTTNAEPPAIKSLLAPLAAHVWSQGERFGTIGAQIDGHDLEVTTHRAERYDPESRKPIVTFGDRLEEDLSRRDFTINAMAIEVPEGTLHDPFDGFADLASRVLRTPLSPEVSFGDDPLRMLRAARFISRFGLAVADDVVRAATSLSGRLSIVSVERINDELERLLVVADPSAGLEFMTNCGLLTETIGPLAPDEATVARSLAAAPGSPLVRRAGLLWSSDVAAVVRRLRYSNHDQMETTALVREVRGWVDGRLSSPATARRLVATAGLDAPRALARNLADTTAVETPVRKAAMRLVDALDRLEVAGDVGPYESPLSGSQVMEILDVRPGPVIGRAQRMLRQHRLDHGPFTAEEAAVLLRRWNAEE